MIKEANEVKNLEDSQVSEIPEEILSPSLEASIRFFINLEKGSDGNLFISRSFVIANSLINIGRNDAAKKVIDNLIEDVGLEKFFDYITSSSDEIYFAASVLHKIGENDNFLKLINLSFEKLNERYLIIKTCKLLLDYGYKDIALKKLVETSTSFISIYDIDTINNWSMLMSLLINYGFVQEATEQLNNHKQRLIEYRNDKQKGYKESIYIDACFEIAKFSLQLNMSDANISSYFDDAVDNLVNLPKNYGENNIYAISQFLEKIIQINPSEDVINKLLDLGDSPLYKKRVLTFAAYYYAEVKNLEKSEEFYSKELNINIGSHNLEQFSLELKLLYSLGKVDEVRKLVEDKSFYSNFNLNREAILLKVGEVLCEVGLYKEFESLLVYEIDNNNFRFSNMFAALNILGNEASFSLELLTKVLINVDPENRERIIFRDFSQLDDIVIDLEKLGEQIIKTPDSKKFSSLLPFIINIVEKKSFVDIKNNLIADAEDSKENEIDQIKFLLLEFSSIGKIERLINILILCREKVSISKIDSYRALLENDEVMDMILDDKIASLIIYLAKNEIITESKHLLYLDRPTMLSIDKIIKDAGQDKINKVLPFIARILKSKTSYISSVVLCVNKLNLKLEDQIVQDDIFEILESLNSITPTIFRRYRVLDSEEKKRFIEGINKLKELFYKNVQITPNNSGLSGDGFDELLAEYISVLYKPVGMSSQKIQDFLGQLYIEIGDRDLCTELLEDLKLSGKDWDNNQSCFVKEVEVEQLFFKWKRGKKIGEKINMLGVIVVDDMSKISSSELLIQDKIKKDSIFSLLRSKDSLQPESSKLKTEIDSKKISVLSGLLSFIPHEQLDQIQGMKDELESNDPNRINSLLIKLSEIFGAKTNNEYQVGIVISDHWTKNLKIWLTDIQQRDTLSFKDIVSFVGTANVDEMVKILFGAFDDFVLLKLSRIISSEKKKIEHLNSTGKIDSFQKLRFYPSKNMPSFFAKASAGICTSEHVALFVRRDHFHINVVDESTNEVVGNIQAYIIKDGNKKILMMRGINPTVKFVNPGNARGFIKAALEVGREIAEKSGFDGFYLSESLEGWHADSNRPEINSILRSEFLLKTNETFLKQPFNISDKNKITKIHKVWEKERKFRKFGEFTHKLLSRLSGLKS